MTRHAHLKERIRARMARTGERYAAARRHVLAQRDDPAAEPSSARSAHSHLAGNIPATTALRALLRHARVVAPHNGEPFSEALLLGIAGGIGIGVFSFFYEREDIATFFLAGRHRWHDDKSYLVAALERLGLAPVIYETAGARAAEAQLRAALAEHGPCIAWVDGEALPYRGAAESTLGNAYHVVTVYEVDDAAGSALIGDLADAPLAVPLATLAAARGRIKKDRHRLLCVGAAAQPPPLATLVAAGLRVCHTELERPTLPGSGAANARLGALAIWAERMEGSRAKERWERVYRPGRNMFRGLCSIHNYIEHYGTGGGLCRPLMADFLAEAAAAMGRPDLHALGERYAALGRDWSALAEAALPDHAPLLREARLALTEKAALLHAGAPAEELRAVWARLAALEEQAGAAFPLREDEQHELRAGLRERISALHAAEVAAHAALAQIVADQL